MNVSVFKNIFSKLRSETAMTQGEIATALGVSKSTVAMWETGKRLPSPELYEQIADYFNVDMDYLYGRSTIRQKIHYDPDGNAQHTLRPDEERLLNAYNALNALGKEKAVEYIEDLSGNEKFTKFIESLNDAAM